MARWLDDVSAAMRFLSFALAMALAAGVASAQTNTGEISGVARDTSDAVLPGVTITVTNVGTALKWTAVTDPRGAYVVTNLPVGPYTVSAELEGFRKAEKTGFDLSPDARITANFTLSLGALTEVVEVTVVRGETVNRTSGEIARVIDGDQVRDLALSGRNYLELASLIPGAVQLEDDQMALTTSLSTTGTVINGARGNSNNLTVDGGFNLDSGSNGSQINNVGLDFIDQVAIQTSNFNAQYGRNSGAAINVVTKGGTNRFGGSVFETYRDESLDASEFFAPQGPDGKKIKGQLNFHNYGVAFGGPIRRNRLFFFTGLDFKSLDRVDGPFRRTMPTRADLRGDFSARWTGPDGIVGTSDDSGFPNQFIDPVTREPFPNAVIPANRITPDGRAIARVYEAMIERALQYSNLPTGNNTTYQLDFPFDWRQEIVRVDYKPNSTHGFYIRYLHDHYDLIEPRGTFITADLPTISTTRLRPGFGWQASHSWVIGPNLVNEAKANASWNAQRVPPYGDAWRRDTYGFSFPQVFSAGRYDEGIPDVTVTGFPALTGPSRSLLSPTTDIALTNTLTWIRKQHSMRMGGLVIRNRKDQNGRAAHTGSLSFNASGNPNTTGYALADALLGNFRTYSEGADDPLGFFRFTQYGAYLSDTWRIRRNLSLEMGGRYELANPTYSQQNNLVNFDPALYDPRLAATVLRNGALVAGSGNRYTGLIRAGDGIPEDQGGRVTLDERAAPLIPTGAPRGLYRNHHLLMPRFSAAYSLTESTVLRGGVGLFYDKPEGNVIFSQVNLQPFLPSVSVENGNVADPLGGRPAAATVLGGINAIDPHLKVPKQWNFSVSLQRELRWGHFAEVSYVGNRGRDLLWQPEINAPSFEDQVANNLLPTAERANTNFMRPYKGYSSIRQRRSDAFTDYNSLQLYVNKRRGDLVYSVSYTLSKAFGNASGNGDNPEDAFNFEFNTGPTSYDRRHVLVTTWTYRVPFLRNRRTLLASILGGWEVSGKTRWQSGEFLTPVGNTSIGNRRTDYLGGEIRLGRDDRTIDRWFNTDVFAAAPDTRRGTAGVRIIEGPHRTTEDLSLRKNFRFTRSMRLQVRGDFFNVLNRVNLSNPNVTVTSGSFGRIGDSRPARQTQLSLRLSF